MLLCHTLQFFALLEKQRRSLRLQAMKVRFVPSCLSASLSNPHTPVVPIKLPFDCWEVAWTTWKLYFQTGAAEQKAVIAEGREQMIPSLQRHLEIFDIKELSVSELFALNTKQMKYKAQMAEYWSSTAQSNSSKLPLDAIICPVHPSAGYPHDFTCVRVLFDLIYEIHQP